MRKNKKELSIKLMADNVNGRKLDTEMTSLKPEIILLYKQRDQHQSWLLSHGSSVEDINQMVITQILDKEMPHNDEHSWLFPDVDRPKAEEMLMPREHGTFLIRRTRGADQHALSIKCGTKVDRCRINPESMLRLSTFQLCWTWR